MQINNNMYNKFLPVLKTNSAVYAIIYADLIHKGIKNLSDVPNNKELRDAINTLLKQDQSII